MRLRMRLRALAVAGPLALGLLAAGCSASEDFTDYADDLYSYIEDDEEIFGDHVVPGDDAPYRSLDEVPGEAPATSSPEERAALADGLVADREKAQHTAAQLRARIEAEDESAPQHDGAGSSGAQIRTVYRPIPESADPATQGGE